MAQKFTTDPDYNRDYLAEIGLIVVEFSALEFTLRNLIKRLLSLKLAEATSITGSVNFIPPLCHIVYSLAKVKFGTHARFRYLEKLLKESLAINEPHRNNIVHSFWTRKNVTNEEIRLKPTARHPAGVDFKSELTPIESLRKLSKRVRENRVALEAFRDNELPALLDATQT